MMSETQYRALYGAVPGLTNLHPTFIGKEKVVSLSNAEPKDPPICWYTRDWTHRDLAGRTLPTRHGDNNLGYLHYSQPHNVITERPTRTAYQDNSPNVILGTHLEYLASVTNGASIQITFRAVQEQSNMTSDRVYRTPDGTPIGTITAYCDGMQRCPDFIN
jgi:hypothetical protein